MNHLTNFSLHKNFNLQNSLQRKYVLPDMCVYHKLIFRIKEVKLGDEIIYVYTSDLGMKFCV